MHAKNLAKWRQAHKGKDEIADLAANCENPENDATTWVVAKIPEDAPHNKLKPRWSGPYVLMGFKKDSASMIKLWDTVSRKVREAPLNSVEIWNCSFDESVEGLTRIRETDYADLSYPMEAILGVALDTKNPDVDPVPLSCSEQTKIGLCVLYQMAWLSRTDMASIPSCQNHEFISAFCGITS